MAQKYSTLQHKYTALFSAKSIQIMCGCESTKLFHNNIVSELLIWQTQQQYFLFRTFKPPTPVPISCLMRSLIALQFGAVV